MAIKSGVCEVNDPIYCCDLYVPCIRKQYTCGLIGRPSDDLLTNSGERETGSRFLSTISLILGEVWRKKATKSLTSPPSASPDINK